MNGIKRAKETWNARDKNAARNGEDRKITRKSSRIEDRGETSQGGNVARVLRPSFYSLWGIKKQRETKRRVTWSLEQDKENKRKEEERERETPKTESGEEEAKRRQKKIVGIMWSGPYFIETRAGKQQAGGPRISAIVWPMWGGMRPCFPTYTGRPDKKRTAEGE